MSVTVGEEAFGEGYALLLWGNILRDVTGKTESGVGVRSSQFIYGT